jgi:hypothetical protein
LAHLGAVTDPIGKHSHVARGMLAHPCSLDWRFGVWRCPSTARLCLACHHVTGNGHLGGHKGIRLAFLTSPMSDPNIWNMG